jgi:hypothetical protein
VWCGHRSMTRRRVATAGHPPPPTMTASPGRPAARAERCAGRLITTPRRSTAASWSSMTGSDASRHQKLSALAGRFVSVEPGRPGRPSPATAKRRRRAALCRRSRPGSRPDLHRRPQPAIAGDPAAGRSGWGRCGRAGHRRRVARRGLQLDVPALTAPLCTNMWMACAQRRRVCAYAVEMLGIALHGHSHDKALYQGKRESHPVHAEKARIIHMPCCNRQ